MCAWQEIKTLGQLKASGYRAVSIREEMRRNLIAMVRAKHNIFPGIIGYDDTVIPQRHPFGSGYNLFGGTRASQIEDNEVAGESAR